MTKKPAKPLIVAHRGASALAPENTIAAFHKAIESGAEGIEFDVRLAGDGVPVVFHDADLLRLANQTALISSVSSADLGRLDVGSWFNRANPGLSDADFSHETVPTLVQFLDFLKGYRGRLYVELKCRAHEIPELVRAVGDLVTQTGVIPQTIVKSFKLGAVGLTKKLFPEITTACLFKPRILNVINKRRHLLTEAENVGANEISLHYSLATKHLVKRAAQRGMPTTIWTVDHPRWIKRSLNLDVAAVITNDPARLLARRTELFQKLSRRR